MYMSYRQGLRWKGGRGEEKKEWAHAQRTASGWCVKDAWQWMSKFIEEVDAYLVTSYMSGEPVQSETDTFPAFWLGEELHQEDVHQDVHEELHQEELHPFLWIGREDCVIWLASVWYTFGNKMTLSVKRITKFSQEMKRQCQQPRVFIRESLCAWVNSIYCYFIGKDGSGKAWKFSL